MSDARRPENADRWLIETLLDAPSRDSSADTEGLIARLEDDAEALDYLLDRAVLHAGLWKSLRRRSLAAWAVGPVPEAAPATTASRRWLPVLRSLAAACCLVLALAAPQLWSPRCATVTMGIGTTGLATGQTVGREVHELPVGVLELRTHPGTLVVIEAPASFRFESPQRVHLTKGRIAADVPQRARGFTVVTPSGEAIDLGTRFAVDVPPSGAAEVHVFDGAVVTRAGDHAATSLRDGEAFSLATNASCELRTAAFIRGDEVAELAAAFAAGQERRSHQSMRRLREDPSLIAIVDFEAGPPTTDDRSDAVGQFRLLQGRWPGSRAADFTDVGDHLPLAVGGDVDWPQLTVTSWVRLDRLGEPFHSLYHTDGWTKQNPGQVHWMIVDSGVMRLAMPGWRLAAGATERHGHPESRTSVIGTEGRWIHLAFVYDTVTRTVRFYVDGRPDGVTRLEKAPPARLGPARVGNWNNHDRKLSGRIDELVFVGRALAADEIRDLSEAGAPYRSRSR
jgi:hypothetical protein